MTDETDYNGTDANRSLLTPELRDKLLANGRSRDTDHIPVVKFFNPAGPGVWLASELDADGSTLFGVADLGEPEFGSFSLAELESLTLPFGLKIERDPHFVGRNPISIYAEAARLTGSLAEGIRFIGIMDALRRGDA